VTKPRALDLFCGAGGATRGLQLAGFHVTGVDLVRSPRYVGDEFVQANALNVQLSGFDFIWASPPCQAYSTATRAQRNAGKRYPAFIDGVRLILAAAGAPYAIENVVGAPLCCPTLLCGTMFGLRLLRHRLFETSFVIGELLHPCSHRGNEIGVYGGGTTSWHRRRFGRNVRDSEKRTAMGIDWMSREELSQAIPPVYAQFIGRAALAAMERAA
jgi:DNA (cytosine-5)-methyltransferase 1